MTQLYRGMKETSLGQPKEEWSSRGLGVRPGIDVPALFLIDLVYPFQGGLSVAPDDPFRLPRHRRPPEFNGTGRDPVWVILDTDLKPNLRYRPDPADSSHGFIEPAQVMTLDEFQDALFQVKTRWQKAPLPPATP